MRCEGCTPQIRSCPCNCKRRARCTRFGSFPRQPLESDLFREGVHQVMTREPGDLPAWVAQCLGPGKGRGTAESPFERQQVVRLGAATVTSLFRRRPARRAAPFGFHAERPMPALLQRREGKAFENDETSFFDNRLSARRPRLRKPIAMLLQTRGE